MPVRRIPALVKVMFAALMATMLQAASAGENDSAASSMFTLRGFGTLGMTHSDQDQADFVRNFFQNKGAGYSRSWSANVDSRLGVQLDAAFSERFSGVIQAVAQYRHDSTYSPHIEWANLSYRVTPDLTLRVGRFAASTFLFSEAQLVGYTYPWIRPPHGVLRRTSDDAQGWHRCHLPVSSRRDDEFGIGDVIRKLHQKGARCR